MAQASAQLRRFDTQGQEAGTQGVVASSGSSAVGGLAAGLVMAGGSWLFPPQNQVSSAKNRRPSGSYHTAQRASSASAGAETQPPRNQTQLFRCQIQWPFTHSAWSWGGGGTISGRAAGGGWETSMALSLRVCTGSGSGTVGGPQPTAASVLESEKAMSRKRDMRLLLASF